MDGIKKTIRVGLVKAVPEKWFPKHNWQLFEMLFEQAQERGVELICTPECFLDGYVAPDSEGFSDERFMSIAESVDGGEYIGRTRALAAKHGVHIIFGFTEAADEGAYNAAAFIGPDGEVIGVYHKTHLLDHDEVYLKGESLPVYDTAFGKIGIMICADRRWPETARTLRLKGAELIMNPTYGMHHLDNEWWMRTRSYENEMFICFAHPEVALITDPEGKVAAKLESNLPDVLVHDIDLSEIKDEMFSHRRPDIYNV